MLRAQPNRTSIFGWLYVVATREALQVLASLPDRRADLTLLVAGISYREIGQMTGGRTHTNVILGTAVAKRAGNDREHQRHVIDEAQAVDRIECVSV